MYIHSTLATLYDEREGTENSLKKKGEDGATIRIVLPPCLLRQTMRAALKLFSTTKFVKSYVCSTYINQGLLIRLALPLLS